MVDRYTDYYFNPKPCVERLRRSPVSVLYTVKQTRKQGASCKQVTKSVEGNLVSRSWNQYDYTVEREKDNGRLSRGAERERTRRRWEGEVGPRGEKDGLLDAPAGDVRKGTSCLELHSPGGHYYCFSPATSPSFFVVFFAFASLSSLPLHDEHRLHERPREHHSSALCLAIIYMLMKNPWKGAISAYLRPKTDIEMRLKLWFDRLRSPVM